jgi:aminoglycoside phosphotransferase (APT) family kinase protein
MNLEKAHVEAYLAQRLGRAVEVLGLHALGSPTLATDDDQQSLKRYGYGQPILIRYRADGAEQRAVLRTMAPNPFGHERRSDRAAGLLLGYDTFNDVPRHVRALDIGMLRPDGRLASIGDSGEFFLLTDYVDGALYADDLQRLRDTGRLTERDIQRAEQLARYLATIHAAKRDDPALYRRAIRDMVGSGEGIFGLTDSYPPTFPLADAAWLAHVEHASIAWRWRLNAHPERLAQTHGDFHPFNVLFDDALEFQLLDRSRGGWGEPADDVTCMAINYLFFGLQRSGKLAPPFEQLWEVFWRTYLVQTGDSDLLSRVAPFFAWRALVVASPAWYNVADAVRRALFRFIDAVLDAPRFDPARVNIYLAP